MKRVEFAVYLRRLASWVDEKKARVHYRVYGLSGFTVIVAFARKPKS